MTETAERIKCKPGSTYRRCENWANGEDGFCGVHRRVAERRAGRNAYWERQNAQWTYVKQWRAKNPDDTFGDSWVCPLCNEALQVKISQAAEYALPEGRDLLQDDIAEHKRWHREAWTAYEQAGQPAGEGAS